MSKQTEWSKLNPHFPDIKTGVGYGLDRVRKGDFEKYYIEPYRVRDFKNRDNGNLPIGSFSDQNYY